MNVKEDDLSLQYRNTHMIKLDIGEHCRLGSIDFHRFGVSPDCDLLLKEDDGSGTSHILAGDMFYLAAGCSASLRSNTSSRTRIVVIEFQCKDGQGNFAPIGNRQAAASFRIPQMKNWLHAFTSDLQPGSLAERWQLQARLYAIAAEFVKSSSAPDHAGAYEAELNTYIEKTKRMIHSSYDSALDMESLARGSGVGASQFYRAFRERSGLSPLKYVISTRLNASLRLLADPAVSVSEAAHSVGYSDEYYFSRLFKKQMGLAPIEYASKAQVAIANLSAIFTGDLQVLGITPRVNVPRDWHLDPSLKKSCIEAIRKAKPDRILSGPIPEELLTELSRIAPVSVYHWRTYSWKKRLLEFGRLLGIASVAERWLTEFARKTDNARKLVIAKYPNSPFLLIGVRRDEMWIYGSQRRKFTDLMYDELRFASPPAVDTIGFHGIASLSEAVDLGSGNAIFLIEYPATDADVAALEGEWRLLNDPSSHFFSIRMHGQFLYNAAMHEQLVDQTVALLQASANGK
ncbi:helix-turn-helix domain-containing protein [Candidatus Pristimantibacillus sp. PTI5]|uniref:helix-turn-helix domain-containing protein n=1 Tax=Candidatus Pristimantibacillus sp. PTI5 TaxID=3400422 RepID=UPI003B027B4E